MLLSRITGKDWRKDIAGTNYPEDWVNHYTSRGYTKTDPSRRIALWSSNSFFWGEMKGMIKKKERRVFDEAKEFGLASGVSVPIFNAGVLSGGVGIYSNTKEHEDPRLRQTLTMMVGLFATVLHNLAHAEMGDQAFIHPPAAQISKREADVLRLMVRGMRAAVAA